MKAETFNNLVESFMVVTENEEFSPEQGETLKSFVESLVTIGWTLKIDDLRLISVKDLRISANLQQRLIDQGYENISQLWHLCTYNLGRIRESIGSLEGFGKRNSEIVARALQELFPEAFEGSMQMLGCPAQYELRLIDISREELALLGLNDIREIMLVDITNSGIDPKSRETTVAREKLIRALKETRNDIYSMVKV